MPDLASPSQPRTVSKMQVLLRPVAMTIGLVALIVASAYVSVPLPIGPVPMTMQSLAVLLAGIWAGPRVGAAACLTYLGLGFAGFPVLAGGAVAPGLAILAKPSFGYLVAFVAGAWVAGVVFERVAKRTLAALLALALGHVVIFAGGVGYLCAFVPLTQAVAVGLMPFLAGSVVKILLGVALVSVAKPQRSRP